VLDIICVTPITPATAKFPVKMYAIKKVALEPVMRQLTVLTMLLRVVSIISHGLYYLFVYNPITLCRQMVNQARVLIA
jgi:hypothetical protein